MDYTKHHRGCDVDGAHLCALTLVASRIPTVVWGFTNGSAGGQKPGSGR